MRHRHHPDVVWEEDGDRVVATAPSVGQVMILEGTAALIWHCLDGSTAEEIIRELSEATGAADSDIRPHVTSYLADLSARKLAVSTDD